MLQQYQSASILFQLANFAFIEPISAKPCRSVSVLRGLSVEGLAQRNRGKLDGEIVRPELLGIGQNGDEDFLFRHAQGVGGESVDETTVLVAGFALDLRHHPAESVGHAAAIFQRNLAERLLHQSLLDQAAFGQGGMPAIQVINGTDQCTSALWLGHADEIRVLQFPLHHAITMRATRHQFGVTAESRSGHRQRCEHRLLHVIGVRAATRRLDDPRQQDVVGVAVLEARTRFEFQRQILEVGDQFVDGGLVAARGARLGDLADVLHTRGMGEQLAQAHLGECRWQAGQHVADGLVELQFSGLHQLQHGERGELLGHRGQRQDLVRGHRHPVLHVGQSESFTQQYLVALAHQHHAARLGAGEESLGTLLQLYVQFGG